MPRSVKQSDNEIALMRDSRQGGQKMTPIFTTMKQLRHFRLTFAA